MSEPDEEDKWAPALDRSAESEIEKVLRAANRSDQPPVTPVASEGEAEHAAKYDPMASKQQQIVTDGGLNVVHSLINRTIFFDLFRHIANKRFADIPPEDRVRQLAADEPVFYKISKWSDYGVRVLTVIAVVSLAGGLVVKALFF